MYGAETSLWSIGEESARLIMSLLRRNVNSKVVFREKLGKVLTIKSRTVNRTKLRHTGNCSFFSIFPLTNKLMTEIASMFPVKYVCRLNSSPNALLDRQPDAESYTWHLSETTSNQTAASWTHSWHFYNLTLKKNALCRSLLVRNTRTRQRSTALVGLVALQSPTSTNSVETRDPFQTTFMLCCRTMMDGVIGSWMPELARPDECSIALPSWSSYTKSFTKQTPYMFGLCSRRVFSEKGAPKKQRNSIISNISVYTHTFIMHVAISYYFKQIVDINSFNVFKQRTHIILRKWENSHIQRPSKPYFSAWLCLLWMWESQKCLSSQSICALFSVHVVQSVLQTLSW